MYDLAGGGGSGVGAWHCLKLLELGDNEKHTNSQFYCCFSILSRQNILLLPPPRKTTGNISFPLAPGHCGLSPLPSQHSEEQVEDRKDQGSPGEHSQSSLACRVRKEFVQPSK